VAQGYADSLAQAFGRGEVADGDQLVRAWAIMGMNVFLGLRFGVWSEAESVDAIAAAAHDLLANGLKLR
jgi:hypothetical protein